LVPAGHPVHDLRQRHQPEPDKHPGMLTVGDYLFASTVKCSLRFGRFATGILITEVRRAGTRPVPTRPPRSRQTPAPS
jgi:hypothetical protein